MAKEPIKVSSSRGNEFSSEVVILNEKYLIETDSGTPKNPIITTQIYLKGSILKTIRKNYSDLDDSPDKSSQILELMRQQHQSCVNSMLAEKQRREKSLAEYVADVKRLIESKHYQEAFHTLSEKLELHPDDPTLLSYAGLLEGLYQKRYRDGAHTCKKAIDKLKKKMLFGGEFFYPVLYINLGKVYLAGGNRREAIAAFQKAMKVDSTNPEIIAIFKEMGIRRPPPIPFLDRSNFLNKYLGKMRYAMEQKNKKSR